MMPGMVRPLMMACRRLSRPRRGVAWARSRVSGTARLRMAAVVAAGANACVAITTRLLLIVLIVLAMLTTSRRLRVALSGTMTLLCLACITGNSTGHHYHHQPQSNKHFSHDSAFYKFNI